MRREQQNVTVLTFVDTESGIDNSEDPPVEGIPVVTSDDIITIVESARDQFRKSDLINLHSILDYLAEYFSKDRNLATEFVLDVLRRSDLVDFLLKTSIQTDDLLTQYHSIRLLVHILRTSDYAVHNCLEKETFDFLRNLVRYPIQEMQTVGFWMMAYICRVEDGAHMMFDENMIPFICECCESILSDTKTPTNLEILQAISQLFRHFSRFSERVPRSTRLEMLRYYGMILSVEPSFCVDVLEFCSNLVQQMGEVGVTDVQESGIFESFYSIFSMDNDEWKVSIMKVLTNMFNYQRTRGKLVSHLLPSFDRILHMFVNTDNLDVLTWATRLIINISCDCRTFDWFFQSNIQERISSIFRIEAYTWKTVVSQLVWFIMGLGSAAHVQNLFLTELPEAAIEMLETSSDGEVKRALQAIWKGMAYIDRYGLSDYESYHAFQEILSDALVSCASRDDPAVKKLADEILQSSFPEIYYS